MSKKENPLIQSQIINSNNNSMLWSSNNNLNGNISINENFNSGANTIKRSGSITFKKYGYDKNISASPIITPSSHYKQIKFGQNGTKSKSRPKNISTNNLATKTEGSDLEVDHAKIT